MLWIIYRYQRKNQAIAAGGGVITGLTGMIDEYSKTNPTYNGYTSTGTGVDTTNKAFQSPLENRLSQQYSGTGTGTDTTNPLFQSSMLNQYSDNPFAAFSFLNKPQ